MLRFALSVATAAMMLASVQAWAPAYTTGLKLNLRPDTMSKSRTTIVRNCARNANRARMVVASGTAVETVDPVTLDTAMKNFNEPLIVDFSAESRGCGPCLLISPQLEMIAKEYSGRIRVLKIDTDKFQGLTSSMKITALPTLIFYNKGETVLRVEGAMMSKKIRAISEYAFFGGAAPRGVDLNSRVWEAAKVQV